MTFNVPEWFDLKLYEKTRKYTRRQWAADFQIRRDIYKKLLEIRNEAQIYAENTEYSAFIYWKKRPDLGVLKTQIHMAVKYQNLAQTAGDTSKAISRAIVKYYECKADAIEIAETDRQKAAKFEADGLDNILEASACVDFSRTDNAIIEDFKAWLKEQREWRGYGNIKILDRGEIARLYPNRVLPFLDLWLWNEINAPNNRFGNGLFAYNWKKMNALLFPPETLTAKEAASKTAETLRKTTYKQAMRILNCDVLPF